jgi:hypothetical protein
LKTSRKLQRRIQALEFALYAHGHEQFKDAFIAARVSQLVQQKSLDQNGFEFSNPISRPLSNLPNLQKRRLPSPKLHESI